MEERKPVKEFGMTTKSFGQDDSIEVTMSIKSSNEISVVNQKKISKLLSKVATGLLEEPNKKLKILISI